MSRMACFSASPRAFSVACVSIQYLRTKRRSTRPASWRSGIGSLWDAITEARQWP